MYAHGSRFDIIVVHGAVEWILSIIVHVSSNVVEESYHSPNSSEIKPK